MKLPIRSLALRATNKGICSLDLCGTPLDVEDMKHLSLRLFNLFGDTFTMDRGTSSVFVRQAAELWNILVADGWSRERFEIAMEGFRRKKFYGKEMWCPEDFLSCSPERDLHGDGWVEDEALKNQSAMKQMEGFRYNGIRFWRYKTEDSPPLPPEFVQFHPPSGKNWKTGKSR